MTPSKKMEIYSKQLLELGQDPLPVYQEPAESPMSRPDLAKQYPLVLIAGSKVEPYTHSMMRNIPSLRHEAPEDLLEIHPKTAAEYDIEDGNSVSVKSSRGRITCRATVSKKIAPGVVHLFFGYEDSNANVLTDHAAFDLITGSTGLKSLLCQVEKV